MVEKMVGSLKVIATEDAEQSTLMRDAISSSSTVGYFMMWVTLTFVFAVWDLEV